MTSSRPSTTVKGPLLYLGTRATCRNVPCRLSHETVRRHLMSGAIEEGPLLSIIVILTHDILTLTLYYIQCSM